MIDIAWERKATCIRCGLPFRSKAAITADHLHPKALGVDNSLSNLAPAHGHCNSSAGARFGNRMRARRRQ